MPASVAPGFRLPLVVTADADLLDALLRIAAAAGTEVDVAPDPAAARPRWSRAPLVVVGVDQAPTVSRARLPRRQRVVVAGCGPVSGSSAAGPVGDPGSRAGFGGDTAGGVGLGPYTASGGGPGLHGAPAGGPGSYAALGGGPGPQADPGFNAASGGGPSAAWEAAEALGAEYVVLLPEAEEWLLRQFGAALPADGAGRVVAVLGGRGGAGASVLAGALAVTAARDGRRALLVDADPFGGGLDLILGWETVDGLRWPALTGAEGALDPFALVRSLPQRGDLVMVSFDRGEPLPLPAAAMSAVLDAGRRARDIVVVDLPRRLDDAAVAALQGADQALLVVPAELRATAAATQVAKAVALHCASVSVVVRGPAPGNLSAAEVARSVGFPLAGLLPPEPGIARGLEHGQAPAAAGRGPLAALCRNLLAALMGADRQVAA